MIKGKFTVTENTPHNGGGVEIQLTPVYDATLKPDEKYSKSTHPTGMITLIVDNPPAEKLFVLNKTLWVDFSELGIHEANKGLERTG